MHHEYVFLQVLVYAKCSEPLMELDYPGVMGGKCWFRVDSKSFEISKETVKGKDFGLIMEKS